MTILAIRKHADKTGERVTRYDPVTGDKKLVNPATPGNDHEPWPLKGITFCDTDGRSCEPPQSTSISSSKVDEGIAEGWLERVDGRLVVTPGGPPNNPLAKVHNFVHAEELVFKTLNGDVRYRVVRQPGKVDGEITWYYGLELIDG